MLTCEGYKMFSGAAKYQPKLPDIPGIVFRGTWLYHPERRVWYLNGCPSYPFGTSFHADEIEIIEEDS